MSQSSGHYCCVPQCKSWSKKDINKQLSFHKFPAKNAQRVNFKTQMGIECIDRRKAWILSLKIGKPITNYMEVCSLHFTTEDYLNKGLKTSRGRVLKRCAVPTQNLPTLLVPPEASTSTSRSERYARRSELKSDPEGPLMKNKVSDHSDLDLDEDNHAEEDGQTARSLLMLLETNENVTEDEINNARENTILMCDESVQVNTHRISTLSDFIKTDVALRSFTGINNFEIFNSVLEMIELVHQDTRTHRLNIKERLTLTMTKFKLDLSYITLGMLFNVSGQLCKTYFYEFVSVLSDILKVCIYFPPVEEIHKNMPICFKDFKDCRIVLDCTEIFVQKPSCLCCRIKFYSQYKKNTTIKFMTGVSPAGIITFVSKAYGGRASDKLIFEESELISLLSPNNDAVMVDKGFLIEDICAKCSIRLIRPPFLRNKKQLTAEEARKNQQIASARVHIERSNQRLKIFKIINGKLQWSLVPKIEEIFTIICGITNLSSPILADQRFL